MASGAIRVAHVMHGLDIGGLEQLVLTLCAAGSRCGIEPSVIAFGAGGAVGDLLTRHRVPIIRLGDAPGMSTQAIHGIGRALRERNIDIAHAHDLGPWFNAVAARVVAPRTRAVVTFHQISTPRGVARGAAVASALMSEALIACGEEVRACVKAWSPSAARVELIGNGVPIGPEPSGALRQHARTRLGIPQQAHVVGYLGRLHEEKGVDLLVDAFLDSFAQRTDVHLVLIGTGELEAELRRKVAGAHAARVHLLGEIPCASELLAGFDVYVQPSRREGRSLSMLEAMAAALPTVAQGLAPIREIHVDGETALLVPPCERPMFGEAILRLLADATLRADMGRRARTHVTRFSVDAMAKSYSALYAEVLSGDGSASRFARSVRRKAV